MSVKMMTALRALLLLPMCLLALSPSNVFHSTVGSAVALFAVPITVAVFELIMLRRMPTGVWRNLTLIISSLYLGIGGVMFLIALSQR